ncbi:hypothetical protein BDE02_05G150400 [Populus trichocarpa]|nr:hypothetical protein BDE02_05G150400 [Populus trichocarpa]
MGSLQQEQQLCDQNANTSPGKSERIAALDLDGQSRPHLALIMTSRSISFSHVKLVFGFLCHHILWKKKHRAFPDLPVMGYTYWFDLRSRHPISCCKSRCKHRYVIELRSEDNCWNIANYVAAIVKEDGCHVRVKEGCWCSICSPLTLSKKEATMVGCWWQPTTIV